MLSLAIGMHLEQFKLATERAYWLAWSTIKHVGPVTLKRLWEHFGSLAVAWQAPASELLTVDGIGLLTAERIVSVRKRLNPRQLLAQHEQENESFWTPADSEYPALLLAINDPPPVLYYRGALRLNDIPHALTVGIVGTRRPSAYGKRWTQRLSRGLTNRGAVIVSGLAAGIDTEAHTSCLDHNGLTVAVLGTGVDVVYPQRNGFLYQRIVAHGLVVSEYPDGIGPDKTHFPQRNRIIAGLSRAVLVAEAPARSGALITARLANDYCREVYALPCALDNQQGEGCLNLIQQGAQIILGEKALAEGLEALPALDRALPFSEEGLCLDAEAIPPGQGGKFEDGGVLEGDASEKDASEKGVVDAIAPKVAPPALSPLLAQVLKAVSVEPVLLDHIVQQAKYETGPVLGALVELELLGLVTQLPGMQYRLL
ncbi:MAG: DNA-processing protein DprA [Cyanobacteria bacterium J06626_6]